MTDPPELTSAGDEVATAFAQYLMRSAVASTHALHLNEQVIGCVGRRQISPDTLHSSLMRFAGERATTSQTNVAVAAARIADAIASLNVTHDTFVADLVAVAKGEKQPR